MDSNSPQDAHLRELLDALRPGSDDLSRSEFAELADRLQRDPHFKEIATRSQRFDQSIGDALHDLPIPTGSVDRLLAKLNVSAGPPKQLSSAAAPAVSPASVILSSSASQPAGVKPASAAAPGSTARDKPRGPAKDANSETEIPASPVRRSGVATGRRISMLHMAEVGVLTVAACLAVIAYLFTGSPVEFNASEVVGAAQEFAMQDAPDDWRSLAAEPLPARLTRFVASAAIQVRPTSWREVTDLMGRNGVAYDLRSGGHRATLYVVDLDPPRRAAPRLLGLPPTPPTSALDSQGKAFSAWAQGDLVYVLAVEGGPQQYKAFVAQPGRLAAL